MIRDKKYNIISSKMSTPIKPEMKSERTVPRVQITPEKRNNDVTVLPSNINQMQDVPNPLTNFGWSTIGEKTTIPFVRRGSECYVADQIFFPVLFADFFKVLPQKAMEWIHLKNQLMTQSEADVFNEINVEHCDRSLVGNFHFKPGDYMTYLEDIRQSFEFFQVCRDALCRKQIRNNLFGFLLVGGGADVPFVWSDGQQLMPLFYFDGKSEYLETNSLELTDKWKIGYLKFCCMVQNIGKNHYERNPLKVASFKHVKQMFPADTKFELHWPENINPDLLALEVSERQVKNPPQISSQIQETRPNPPIHTTEVNSASKRSAPTVKSGTIKKPRNQQQVETNQTTNVPHRSPQTASSPGLYNPNIPILETVSSTNSTNTQLHNNATTSIIPQNSEKCASGQRIVPNLITPAVREKFVAFIMKCLRLYGPNQMEYNMGYVIQQFVTQFNVAGPKEQLWIEFNVEIQGLWREIKQDKALWSMPTEPNCHQSSAPNVNITNVTNAIQDLISAPPRINVGHQGGSTSLSPKNYIVTINDAAEYARNYARVVKLHHISYRYPRQPYKVTQCSIRHTLILGITISPFVSDYLVNFSQFVTECLHPKEYEYFRLSNFTKLYSLNDVQNMQWQKLQQSGQVRCSGIFPHIFVLYNEILTKLSSLR